MAGKAGNRKATTRSMGGVKLKKFNYGRYLFIVFNFFNKFEILIYPFIRFRRIRHNPLFNGSLGEWDGIDIHGR